MHGMHACALRQFYVAAKTKWNNTCKIIWHTQQPVTNVRRQHYHSRLDFLPSTVGSENWLPIKCWVRRLTLIISFGLCTESSVLAMPWIIPGRYCRCQLPVSPHFQLAKPNSSCDVLDLKPHGDVSDGENVKLNERKVAVSFSTALADCVVLS